MKNRFTSKVKIKSKSKPFGKSNKIPIQIGKKSICHTTVGGRGQTIKLVKQYFKSKNRRVNRVSLKSKQRVVGKSLNRIEGKFLNRIEG